MTDRIAAMISDLMENGANGAAGAALIVAGAISLLIVAIGGAGMKKGDPEERRKRE